MGKMDQGFRDLLAEVIQLVSKAIDEKMKGEEFCEGLGKINQKMSDQYGRVIDAIGMVMGIELETVPASGEEEEGGRKERSSLRFQFGASKEDREIGKEFGLDDQEMNQLLELARQEGDDGKGKDDAVPADAENLPQFPEEAAETEETAKSPDPRNVSQIINSIRETARALNFQKRRFVILRLQEEFECLEIKLPKTEQLKEDVIWLQVIQDFISAVRAVRKGEDAILSMDIILNFEQVLLQLLARGS